MTIKSIDIENFLSVHSLHFDFSDGLHLLSGDNGAGKSTILQAVSVGLYNKCERPQPWARIGGRGGFLIKVKFVDVDGNDIIVINDKYTSRFEVFINGELETHQISKGLPIVAERLNISYHEFTMLSFLTPTTITSILTGTDSSLISKFFNLSVLAEYDKVLTDERRVLNKEKKLLQNRLMEAVETPKEYDVESIRTSIKECKLQQVELHNSHMWVTEIPLLKKRLLSIDDEMKESKMTLRVLEKQLDTMEGVDKVCPTCGTELSDTTFHVGNIIELRKDIDDITSTLDDLATGYISLSEELRAKEQPINDEYSRITADISKFEGELVAATILNDRDVIDVQELNNTIGDIEEKVIALTTTMKAIKSGSVHKSYLQTFVAVLNSHLGALTTSLNIKTSVLAKIDDKGLSFNILDSGVYKFSDVLSAGEKVIVGLLVLSAMFKTLKETLNININILMLDEAVAAVSTHNMPIIKAILEELGVGRCVIITQHHDELPEDIFDYKHLVVKVDNLTEII